MLLSPYDDEWKLLNCKKQEFSQDNLGVLLFEYILKADKVKQRRWEGLTITNFGAGPMRDRITGHWESMEEVIQEESNWQLSSLKHCIGHYRWWIRWGKADHIWLPQNIEFCMSNETNLKFINGAQTLNLLLYGVIYNLVCLYCWRPQFQGRQKVSQSLVPFQTCLKLMNLLLGKKL